MSAALVMPDAALFARLRKAAPRVQCLTNTVAQAITANALHAIGARASMASHPTEIVSMTASADAALINLGTPDQTRMDAIDKLLASDALLDKPVVLDPVFAHASPLRRAYADRLMQALPLIIKANHDEQSALRIDMHDKRHLRITTGPTDRVQDGLTVATISGGHHWMSAVTGLGCALGAVIAAYAAIEKDRVRVATAALLLFKRAGEFAAARSEGPGSFAVAFIDHLERLSQNKDQ